MYAAILACRWLDLALPLWRIITCSERPPILGSIPNCLREVAPLFPIRQGACFWTPCPKTENRCLSSTALFLCRFLALSGGT